MSLFFTKFNVKRIVILAILLNICIVVNATTANNLLPTTVKNLTPQKIYAIAQDRNGKALSSIRKYIDIKDKNGNTALCLAQQNKDKNSFKMLLVFGASTDVDCYDKTDPVCAIIAGEKLKIRGAGWLLGAAATAGAIYGASELLDNKKCPSGYSVQYQSVADCGKTGAAGWIYDWNKKDEKGKLCGRCTPKTYDTGCTTLWQSVNDCGEHPEGWNFETSGFSGDEVCGICTPKPCVKRDSTSIRGENIRYTDITYCPHREYMRPTSQEQKGWSGVHGCYICNYACDEKNGFVAENNCEKNAAGQSAYHCAKNADTQCYYKTTPKICPNTDTITTRGSNTSFSTTENCPFRKYMIAENVTPGTWSGEGQCYTCNYKCDEQNGFAAENNCEKNAAGQSAYHCAKDTDTQCYYRTTPKTCPNTDTLTARGSNISFSNLTNCPFRKYMTVTSVTPGTWSGEGQCYTCNYACDGKQGFATETTCKTNASGGEGYICQKDASTTCWFRSGTPTPDNPDGGSKDCPIIDTPTTKGASTIYTNKNACPFRKYMVAESVTPNGWHGEEQCYNCNYKCDEQNGFANETTCKTNESGGEGYICHLDPSTRCYYRSSTPNPDNPNNPNTPCPEGYSTDYQNQSNCAIIGGIPEGWTWTQNGWSGELKCGKCEPKACAEGIVSTELTDLSKCPKVTYKKPISFDLKGYSGTDVCYGCIYACDNKQNAFDDQSPCRLAPDYGCELKDGCWVVSDGCTEGSIRYQSVKDCGSSGARGWSFSYSGYGVDGKRCGICTPLRCTNEPSSENNCGSTGALGWEIVGSLTDFAGDTACKECRSKGCTYGQIGDCEGNQYISSTNGELTGEYSGDSPCHYCNSSCQFGAYTSKAECENNISDSDIGIKYCADGGTGCWIIVNCNAGTPLNSIEQCPGYQSVFKDFVTFTPTSTKGQCNSCGFSCPTNITEGSGGVWISSTPCDAENGWNSQDSVIVNGEKCYYCVATVKTCWSYGTEIDGDYCYNTQCKTGSANCSCDEKNHTFSVRADGKVGGLDCYQCEFANCPLGYTTNESNADLDDTNGCSGGSKCYKQKTTTAAMMTMFNDIANNQNITIHHTEGDYAGNTNINAYATAPITDELTGEVIGGDAVASITVYNSAANAEVTLQAGGDRAVFNARADGENAESHISAEGKLNLIMEKGAENTIAAGITTNRNAYNAYADGNAKASGAIDINDTQAATNVIYGILARRNAYNAVANGELAQANGIININTATDKHAYGMYAGQDVYNQSTSNQTSIVNVTGTGKGDLYGLYSEQGSVYNSGNINVHAAHGNAYGIYVANGEGQIVDNSGNIIVASDTKTAYGIYIANAGEGMTLINSGLIDATGDENSRGIKVASNGQNAIVSNTGRIIVNGTENSIDSAIDLGGGTLANAGEIEFIGTQNLNDLNGKAILEKGGKYKADSLSGNLKIGKSVVMEGFEDVYRQKDGIASKDIDGLNITSESAMFKASAEKNNHSGYDAVATRRNFNEFAYNDSVAKYLEENYKRQRLAEMFMQLKSNETDLALSQDILSETGADFLINIPAENLAALRNAGEVLADSALTPTDETNRIMSGADSYIINANGRRGATGYDTTAATAYMYGDKRLDNKNRLGLGLSFMQMSTSYDNSVDRKENFVSIFIPWIHKFSDKLRLASIFTAGYGYGNYDRGSDREADIQDIIYGITNKLVYEINLADIAELEPALILNAIGYYQDEMDDGTLTVKGGNHLSVEAGIGLYIKKELMDSKYGKLTARLGGMYYHELADPYNKMRAGFNGGVGSFEINDFANIYSRDRAVLSAMLDYEYKRLALYLKYFHMLQRNKSQNFDMGIRYNF